MLNDMEYKKSEPIHGKLDQRYATLYEYEFPRATRAKGKFLPLGSVRLREYLYCDGEHGQLVQITRIPADKLAQRHEAREMVDHIINLGRESKMFRDGILTREDITGEIREYPAKKLICLDEILADQEKIGMFASARRVKDSKRRLKRTKRWKIRIYLLVILMFFVSGGWCGVLLQKHNLLDLHENAFYQEYVLASINSLWRVTH
ncbi:MAG: hypothetical protein P8Y84_06670 [Desulfuromonadales bacterium]